MKPLQNVFTRGSKIFELSNHLGNVLVTASDKKLQHTTDNTTVDYYNADIVTANDYYPGGTQTLLLTKPVKKFASDKNE